MKYAFVSDIHANLQAWQAVWRDRLNYNVDAVICLGDLVGYGPRPAETVAVIRATTSHVLMGNHDAAVCGLFDTTLFNDEAREMVAWTIDNMPAHAGAYLAKLPYVAEIDCETHAIICAHASMHNPREFPYIFTESDARNCWASCDAPVVFVGHTHLPRVDILERMGGYRVRLPKSFALEAEKRYIVNVGSVGMPRVGDIKACYCTYDTATRLVEWHHVEYDIEAYKHDVETMMGGSEAATRLLSIFATEKKAGTATPELVIPTAPVPRQGLGL